MSLGRQLIRLSETIIAGGRRENGHPKLAVMRADIETVRMTSWVSGQVRFQPHETNWRKSHRAPSKVLDFHFPARNEGSMVEGISPVPLIPPQFRPGPRASNYHILWEVDRWQPLRRTSRGRIGDPALLKHLRGDLWAVLAVWDLTEVEKAALEAGAV